MNSIISYHFPKLDTSVKVEYRTGASYSGSVKERKRNGRGVFRWPNGSCYEGSFVENKRHGDGRQEWPDGSSYVGYFENDVRAGQGRHTWSNGEVYEGMFFMDKRHGKGIYYWTNGAKYDGYFHNDLKDGFGTFMFGDGKMFQGIYKNNERNGPGILCYEDGRQDVGIWRRETLIRLCSVMENCFVFHHFPDYYVNAGQHLPLKIRRANSAFADSRSVIDTKDTAQDCSDNDTLTQSSQFPKSFPYIDLCEGIRGTSLGPKGHCEVASEAFLHAAANGDCSKVTELLENGFVHVDVADKTGYTALLAASVNCHKDVINCLLDYGGDVNILNCEGLSALAACHVLFYTKHTWKDNIAETLGAENLFNSVRWDIPSGTFIQRKNKGSHSYIKTMVNESPVKVSDSAEMAGKETVHHSELANEVYSAEVVQPRKCDHNKRSYFHNCTRNGKQKGNIINNCDNNFAENDGARSANDERRQCKTSDQYSREDVRRFIDQSLDSVDKNIYINEYLSRTASAMSNQNTISWHENMETSLEKYSLDRKKNAITTDKYNTHNILELNNVMNFVEENCKKTMEAEPAKSIPFSIQNCISSTIIQTALSNLDNDGTSVNSVEQCRQKLLTQQRRPHLEATVRLLLRRGADPNSSSLPMPVLFFAVKAADSAAVEILLDKGARTDARLAIKELGITPLHIAVALPSDAVLITELLLNAGADPDLRDFAFGNNELGRTPLHIACCREDNDEEANRLLLLLLHYKADLNLLCQGNSALSLAIASGNDMVVETLLKNHADPSLPLTHGVGSALCAAVSFSAERRRKPVERMRLVNKLVRSGANILAPIVVNNQHAPGTVVDYAYCVFYQDRRIAQTPYHSLTSSEREIYISRRSMLDHLAELLRTYVLKREKKLLEEQLTRAKSSVKDYSTDQPSKEDQNRYVGFLLDETELKLEDSGIESSLDKVSLTEENIASYVSNDTRFPDCGLRVTVVQTPSDHMTVSRQSMNSSKRRQLIRKNRFRYCYECGRSVGVRLSACTRCKEVYYCSRTCKLKAWNTRHKDECVRLSGTNRPNTSRQKECTSPTPVTNANSTPCTSTKYNAAIKQKNKSKAPLKKTRSGQLTVAH